MLRTSLRNAVQAEVRVERPFLSSNAQDFIEEQGFRIRPSEMMIFLSSNAQDFIEDIFRRAL